MIYLENMFSTRSHLTGTCVLHREVEPHAMLLVARVRSNEQVVLVLVDVLNAPEIAYSETFANIHPLCSIRAGSH